MVHVRAGIPGHCKVVENYEPLPGQAAEQASSVALAGGAALPGADRLRGAEPQPPADQRSHRQPEQPGPRQPGLGGEDPDDDAGGGDQRRPPGQASNTTCCPPACPSPGAPCSDPVHGVAEGRVSTEAALHGKGSGLSRYTNDPRRSAAQMAPPPTASSPSAGSPVMAEGLASGMMHSSAAPAASRSVIQTAPTPAAKPVGRPLGTISRTRPVAASIRATAPAASKLGSVDRPPTQIVPPSAATRSAWTSSRTLPSSRLVAASTRSRPWPPSATQTMRPATAMPSAP